MDAPFFYGQETPERVESTCRREWLTGSPRSTTSRRWWCFLADEGRWITDQTVFANCGYTTRYQAETASTFVNLAR
jgi:hypothetical protein